MSASRSKLPVNYYHLLKVYRQPFRMHGKNLSTAWGQSTSKLQRLKANHNLPYPPLFCLLLPMLSMNFVLCPEADIDNSEAMAEVRRCQTLT
ncbi:Uncharacterised protein [Enterobacter cancerogenus]|uniref:Uncharacterized protein n=1 Tax=Enterobacter cancerogenus TaxID=69218 RepID=A0A484Z2Y8_9ENTR|nr:Uncharacterised protein [Enterobacter cancerogenus]